VTATAPVITAPPASPPADGPAILCQGLTKSYGAVQALVDLNLSVPYGSIFGFLGRNGAGKTTTMRMLAGLALPTSGRAWVAGLETTSLARSARARFGYLPQDPAFYNWMAGREYLDYVAQIQGLDPAERKRQIAGLLGLSGLEEVAKRRIGGYSGGMLQRLGIAQALVGNPPVLLLDEPTSALDPAGRSEVLAMIAGLRGRVTVFLSSHILTDIERVCDTVAILHKGRLMLVSDREALLAQYAVDAVDLELEASALDSPELAGFQQALQAQPWAASQRLQGAVLRVMIQDVPGAKAELLPLVVAHRLPLLRYEWVRPSLEDIFLQLST
jgi:ABC-2 type transport system ATP-binding protein